jgi:hypothetical protein
MPLRRIRFRIHLCIHSYLSYWINEPGVDVGPAAPRWLSRLDVVKGGCGGWLASLSPQLQQTRKTKHLFDTPVVAAFALDKLLDESN